VKVFRVIALICATVMFVSGALSPASAHRQAESYVFFSQSENAISGRIEAILSDIDRMIPLDADQDGEITADEFNARTDEIFSFFADRLSISSGGTPHPLISSGFGILETPAGTFGQISFDLPELDPKTETIDVTYEPLTDNDNPGHLGYGVIENNSNTGVVVPHHHAQSCGTWYRHSTSHSGRGRYRRFDCRRGARKYVPDLASPGSAHRIHFRPVPRVWICQRARTIRRRAIGEGGRLGCFQYRC